MREDVFLAHVATSPNVRPATRRAAIELLKEKLARATYLYKLRKNTSPRRRNAANILVGMKK